jgi:hypothetical protein
MNAPNTHLIVMLTIAAHIRAARSPTKISQPETVVFSSGKHGILRDGIFILPNSIDYPLLRFNGENGKWQGRLELKKERRKFLVWGMSAVSGAISNLERNK